MSHFRPAFAAHFAPGRLFIMMIHFFVPFLTSLNSNLQIKQFLIPATVTHNIDSVSALYSALEDSSMNTLAIPTHVG